MMDFLKFWDRKYWMVIFQEMLMIYQFAYAILEDPTKSKGTKKIFNAIKNSFKICNICKYQN